MSPNTRGTAAGLGRSRMPTTRNSAASTMPRWPTMYWKKTRWGNPAFRSGVMTACKVPAKPQK